MDRTADFWSAVDLAYQELSVPQSKVQQIKSSLLLRPTSKPSAFTSAAVACAKSIHDFKDFVKTHQLDYVSSGTYSDSEKDRIEAEVALVVKACTQQVEQLKCSVLAGQQPKGSAGQPQLSPHVAAHLHGVVLCLAEQLHAVSAAFDKCRAERARQTREQELWRRKRTTRPAAQRRGGAQDANTDSSGASTSGREDGTRQQQQLQAASFAQENQALIDHLNGTTSQVVGLEKTLRDIANLNHMLSTAVLHQAQAIEAIYDNAVEATMYVTRGNTSLTKAVAVNRSSRRYIVVLLLVASLSLLFYDWVNS